MMEETVAPQEVKDFPRPAEGRLDPMVGRIDLIAVIVAALGLCLAGLVAVVMALFELARFVWTLWADPFDRWLTVVLGAAMLWVALRWKKLCVF